MIKKVIGGVYGVFCRFAKIDFVLLDWLELAALINIWGVNHLKHIPELTLTL